MSQAPSPPPEAKPAAPASPKIDWLKAVIAALGLGLVLVGCVLPAGELKSSLLTVGVPLAMLSLKLSNPYTIESLLRVFLATPQPTAPANALVAEVKTLLPAEAAAHPDLVAAFGQLVSLLLARPTSDAAAPLDETAAPVLQTTLTQPELHAAISEVASLLEPQHATDAPAPADPAGGA